MSVVFRGHLAENLRFGHILEICGKAKAEEAKSFDLFLSTEDPTKELNTNIGFYLYVNYEKDKIVLKNRINKQWSNEQSLTYDTQKLLLNFNITLIMGGSKFHIAINHKPFITYDYGLPLKYLNFIEINGDLEYIRQIDHRKYFPYTWPPIQVVEERIQFSNDLPMPMRPGHVMIITAQLMGNDMGRFLVHLRNIRDIERQEFHMSIRFDTRTMAINSKTKEDEEHYDFDDELCLSGFPFEDFLKPFKFALAFTSKSILLAKDGIHLFQFDYRTSNVLPFVGGLKMFGINGTEVRVCGIDHMQMEDSSCEGYEEYSNL